METAAGAAAAGRGGVVSIPSSSSSSSARKEWRAVNEHSVRNTSTEELERTNLGQSDDRTIYEQGSGPPDVDFCSVTIDGGGDDDLLQQRLHSVSRQREELQQMEVELRAQVIARNEILEMQHSFDMQIKEHVNAANQLKEKLQDREHTIHELELKMEEKDRELHTLKLSNEAQVWAKEDLLREQSNELATFRRERDSSEAERIQHLKQIHELQDHIQEKDRQCLQLEEQHRVAQESIMYREEELRQAQAWMARVQEAEQAERIDHFNQLCYSFQRQLADIDRHYSHTVQQLQLELTEARDRTGMYTDESRMAHADSKDASLFGHNNGTQFNVNESGPLSGNSGILPNGNVDDIKTEYSPGVPLVQSSLLGMSAYLPPGQITAMNPMVMHQRDVQHSVSPANSHASQSHLGHIQQQVPAISSHQQWQNQQAVPEGSQISNQSQYLPSHSEQNFLSSGTHYHYELPANGHVLGTNYLDAHVKSSQEPSQEPGPVVAASNEAQVHNTNDNNYLVSVQSQPTLEEVSSKIQEGLRLDSAQQNSETKGQDQNSITVANPLQEVEKEISVSSDIQNQVKSIEATASSSSNALLPELSFSTRLSNSQMIGRTAEPILLDERSLLACIVRAIPAGSGGRIRISSTLPNRLGKMLAPLHWHDYKKKYGKLDDFVASHPELFIIEGDFIHLREGAQKIISATAAVAKVAAAAAVTPDYSTIMPSVAVTPVAQSHRVKRSPSVDSKHGTVASADMGAQSSQLPTMPNQHSNGAGYNNVQALSNVKILSKPKDHIDQNGVKSEFRSGSSSVHAAVANGATTDRTGFPFKGSNNGRHGTNFGEKQPGRSSGSVLASKK